MPNEASRSIDISALNEDSPFHRLLGLTVTRVTPGEVEVVMPYSDRLLANTTSPYVHGGAIATLIDVAGDARALIVYATDGRGQNIRYLPNFPPIYGDALFVMTPPRHGYLLNFDWEIPRAREDSGLEEFTASFDLVGEVGSLLRDLEVTRGRVATIGFDRIPHPMFMDLTARHPRIEVIDITHSVERARRIKSRSEIAQLRRAVQITAAGARAVREALRPGLSEVELAALADYTMKAAGVSILAFPTLVLSRAERVVPVRMPTERRVREGDVVMLDLC